MHGLPLFDSPCPPPSAQSREFPDDAAAAAAAAAEASAHWTESVSFIADIDVRRLRLRPMTATQEGEVCVLTSHSHHISSTFASHEYHNGNIYNHDPPPPSAPINFHSDYHHHQACLGSVDVCDAHIAVRTRAAPLHPSWLDTESQVRAECGVVRRNQNSNLEPRTSNLKPQTSNLKPQTSNLKPQT
jgi:hypothetical protein